MRSTFTLLPDPPELCDEWERLVAAHGVRGKPAHDARLVAAMRLHGITRLLTFNVADYARYAPDVVAIDPATLGGAVP